MRKWDTLKRPFPFPPEAKRPLAGPLQTLDTSPWCLTCSVNHRRLLTHMVPHYCFIKDTVAKGINICGIPGLWYNLHSSRD